VRIKAGLSAAGKAQQEAEKAAAEAGGRKPRQRRLSLLLYLADAHWHTGEVEMWPDGQHSKLGEVSLPGKLRQQPLLGCLQGSSKGGSCNKGVD